MLTITRNGFNLNGVHRKQLVGRSSFKLANLVGQGKLEKAREWVEHNQRIFGKNVVLRVFLETAGWSPCADCMFGSEPRDQGFWNRQKLRDGDREHEMHPLGKRVLEWFFKTSQETGCVFELTIDATLKHDDIPKGEIDHVIRVVGIQMGQFALDYPQALIIPETRNEWNAHNQAGHSLSEVNMWAYRWERDEYWDGVRPICSGGGENDFDYAVGGPGKYAMGLIHPERGENWWYIKPETVFRLREKANGYPIGANESMYYVEKEDRERASRWYRVGGWTTDWARYEQFAVDMLAKFDYIIFHDEKGVQADVSWPREETRLEKWARAKWGVAPPPPKPKLRFERVISQAYKEILGRAPDEDGLRHYNNLMHGGLTEAHMRESMLRSAEYAAKNPEGAK